jgi:outer membrane protein TolC
MKERKRMKAISIAPVIAVIVLSGCATFSADGGMGTPSSIVKERTGNPLHAVKNERDAKAVEKTVKALLQNPLSADDAVQVALIHNRNLQATYAELGIAEADLVQAGRLLNPGFSFKRMHDGESVSIERTLTFNLIDLITMPLAARIERQRFEEVKLQAADAALKVAADTRKAYFETLAAQQAVEYAKQVVAAAEAGADLARRMKQAGNWSALEQAREEAFHADAVAEMAQAQQALVRARESLTRLMGLSGDDIHYHLQERLPELPAKPFEANDAESFALAQRLDIRMMKMETQRTASSLGLTKATRFINMLDVGPVLNTATGEPPARGVEIDIEVPLFDWSQAKTHKAEALYMQSVHRLAAAAIDARSEVRQAYANYRTAYELARHYRDEVVPLHKRISDETLLRYNGMLIGVFELLADARSQIASVNAAIDALKDFWLADADLQTALGGALPDSRHQTDESKAIEGEAP